jgi:hypothetical protein
MGYYSSIDDFSFTSDFNGRLISLKDWNDLIDGRLGYSFLTYAIKFRPELTFSGDYIKALDYEVTYGDGRAYELVSELQALKKFMDDHGITFSLKLTLLGEDNLDVSKYSVSSDLPNVMVAEGVMTFTEFKPARHNPSLLCPL